MIFIHKIEASKSKEYIRELIDYFYMFLENVHSILGIGNSYIIERDDHSIIIDTGYPSDFKNVIKTLQAIATEKPPKYIIITHSHPDHIGTIKKIRTMYNLEVVSHKNEKEYAEGEKFPTPKNLLARGFTAIVGIFPEVSCTIDHTLTHGENFEGFKIHHTPGHTPGSIVLEDLNSKAIFTGDTIMMSFFV